MQNEKIQRRTKITLSHFLGNRNFDTTQNTTSTPKIVREDTCGIIGFVSKRDPAPQYLMEGLMILQNRGYDSAGIATLDKDKNMVISKCASLNTTSDAINRLKESLPRHKGHVIGIAHTRWATHGGKTDRNAHPHTDQKGRIALVHNGVIENASEIRNDLIKKGVEFSSETDTEVIAQLIGVHLDQGLTLLESIRETLKHLEGTWGLAIMSTIEPDRIYAARNGSPMLLGIDNDRMFVASESAAFSRHTRNMISLENGEIAIITADGVKELKGSLKERVETAQDTEITLTPDPYPHWTMKEIYEQPLSLNRALNNGGRIGSESTVKLGGLEDNKDWLLKIEHLVIAACGTSYYAGTFGAKLMRQLMCFETVSVVDAAELEAHDLPNHNAGLLVISQSGETADVLRCLNIAKEKNVPSFSVVNKVGSAIARATGCGVYINAGREHAVASTKAFTSQVTILCLIAAWFSQNKNSLIQERKQLISALRSLSLFSKMILDNIRDSCRNVAKYLMNHHTLFVLGKGYGESIAKEGSLKIKEITYTHAEAYASGALKHGPFALIDEGTPIIILIFNDNHLNLNLTAAHEVRSRGAYVIAITDVPSKVRPLCNDMITIPSNGPILTPLLGVIPLQMIAYELSILKKIDPDKPKNLAKSVTVL